MSGKRIELDGTVAHKGGQQFVNGRALFSDGYTRIHRIESAGFASYPIAGGKGLLLSPNGDADQAYVLGGEHPDHRPDLPKGGTAIYDHNGNIMKLVMSGLVIDVGSRTVTVNAGGGWTLNGDMTVNGDIHLNGNLTATGSVIDGDGDGGA
jgi:phage gp45-like